MRGARRALIPVAAAAPIAVALFAAVALARPKPRPLEVTMPLRIVAKVDGAWQSNCVFSSKEIGPSAPASTPLSYLFRAGDPLWGRCYFPDRLGANRAGDLTDVVFVDGKKWFTQAYERALPADSLEHALPLGDLLRTPLSLLPRGSHHLLVVGQLRRGSRSVRLYRGELTYVR